MSIFENDPYNYEPIGDEESERDEDDSDDDTEHHEISPITEDMVSSITVGVDALKKSTKRSQAEMEEMKEMTMNIMSKISKLDESVKNIQTNTTRTWETVGKIDQKIDQNKDNVHKLLMIKNGPAEGVKNIPTTTQNGETRGAVKEEERRRPSNGTTPGKQNQWRKQEIMLQILPRSNNQFFCVLF